MELLGYMEGKVLVEIKEQLRRIGSSLDCIRLDSLCRVIHQQLKRENVICDPRFKHMHEEQLRHYSRLVCQLFDYVDVDSRGAIHFDDFTSFCMRVARNLLSPALPADSLEFVQDLSMRTPLMVASQMYFLPQTQTLFVISSDCSLVHEFSSSKQYTGCFNPIVELRRLTDKHGKIGTNHYQEKKASDQEDHEYHVPQGERVLVLCMEYIRPRKQLVLSSSNCYLSFWDKSLRRIRGYVRASCPQVGMLYVHSKDMLLTWASTTGDYKCSFWDLRRKVLKYQVGYHSCHIMAMVEVAPHGLVASSDLDTNVLLWGSHQYSGFNAPGIHDTAQSRSIVALKGHSRVIRSLAYAAQQDLILGAGVEFDAYAWDPFTGQLYMHLYGHQHCILQIAVLFDPYERALTLDERGNLKVWNINRDGGGHAAEVLQSFEVVLSIPFKIACAAVTFNDGKFVAVLADRVYFFDNVSFTASSGCPVTNGVLISPLLSEFYIVYPRSVCVADLKTGAIQRTLNFGDNDRDCLLPSDSISVATIDSLGKKVFLGTSSGYIFMLDAQSFGVLRIIHSPAPAPTTAIPDTTGSATSSGDSSPGVVGLCYFDHEELLCAAFTSSTVKVLIGCHRVAADTAELKNNPSRGLAGQVIGGLGGSGGDFALEVWQGGAPPPQTTVFREGAFTLGTVTVAACISERWGLVATSSSDGVVRVFDTTSLKMVGVYLTPVEDDFIVVPVNAMCFLDDLRPVLVAVDSYSRVTLWAVHPAVPAFLFSTRLSAANEIEQVLCAVACASWLEKASTSTRRENPSSSTTAAAGTKQKHLLFVGDDNGGLWVMDISEVLGGTPKPGQKQQQEQLQRRRSYQLLTVTSVGQAFAHEIDVSRLEAMTKEPVGMRARPSLSDRLRPKFVVLKHLQHVHTSAVKLVTVVREEAAQGMRLTKPAHLLVTSDRGVTKLFTPDGFFVGDMHRPAANKEGAAGRSTINNTAVATGGAVGAGGGATLDSRSWIYSGPGGAGEARVDLMEGWLRRREAELLKATAAAGEQGQEQSRTTDPSPPTATGAGSRPSSPGLMLASPMRGMSSPVRGAEEAGATAMSSYKEWRHVLPVVGSQALLQEMTRADNMHRTMDEKKRAADVLVQRKKQIQAIWEGKVRFTHLDEEIRRATEMLMGVRVRDEDLKQGDSPPGRNRAEQASSPGEGRAQLLDSLMRPILSPQASVASNHMHDTSPEGAKKKPSSPLTVRTSLPKVRVSARPKSAPLTAPAAKLSSRQSKTGAGTGLAAELDGIIAALEGVTAEDAPASPYTLQSAGRSRSGHSLPAQQGRRRLNSVGDGVDWTMEEPVPTPSGAAGGTVLDTEMMRYFDRVMGNDDKRSPAKMRNRAAEAAEIKRSALNARLGQVVDVEAAECARAEELRQRAILQQSQGAKKVSRGRYGPYTADEILRFVLLLLDLRPVHPLYFFEGDFGFSLRELVRRPDVAAHPRFVAQVESFSMRGTRANITKQELSRVVFEHATRAERARVDTVSCVCQTLWRLMDALVPPSSPLLPAAHIAVPAASALKDGALIRRLAARAVAEAGLGSKQYSNADIPKIKGFENWLVPVVVLFDCKALMASFYKMNDGTCLNKEVTLMLQRYVGATAAIRQISTLNEAMTRSGLELDGEMDVHAFITILSQCLKLRVLVDE